MCWRFQTGSKSPLANRKARMLLTDSLPRKWSIRKICDSSKTWCTAWLSSLAEARSVPNGFSMMIRLRPSASPVLPSKATVDWNDTGGMARWNSRRARPPRSASARRTAASSGPEPPGSLGCELPNDSAWANAVHPSPSGLLRPNAATACRACSRNWSSVIGRRAVPTMRYRSGIRPTWARWNRPGRSFRLARSPVAPNITMTWSSGRRPVARAMDSRPTGWRG